MTQHFVVRDVGIPPGLVNERRPHVKQGIKARLGRQSAAQPIDITAVRCNRGTLYSYDAEGKIDGIIQVPEAWLVSGDMSGETWTTAAEMRDTFAERLGEELDINPTALGENKLICVEMSHEQVLNMLAGSGTPIDGYADIWNAEFWGEIVA